jgi:hypothetical protein
MPHFARHFVLLQENAEENAENEDHFRISGDTPITWRSRHGPNNRLRSYAHSFRIGPEGWATMQIPDTFLGLTGTGWTGIGSIVSALSILVLVTFNIFYLNVAVQGTKVAIHGIKAQLLSIETALYSWCPVLTLRNECDGGFSIFNCGQGPALMAQFAYGESIPESTVESRLQDNIIPAGDSRSIDLDMDRAKKTGLLLFAYSVTNDMYLTTIKWPKMSGTERFVHFGTYKSELPVAK